MLAFAGLLSVAFISDTRAADARPADKRSILAVMEIEDSSGKLNSKDIRTATEFLRGRLTATGKFIVIDQSRQAAALKKIVLKSKQESYQECRAKECQIPLGQELSADSILRTGLLYMGGGFTLQAELIDLSKEAAVKGATVDFEKIPGSSLARSLSSALRSLVVKLVGENLSKGKGGGAGLRTAGFGAGLGTISDADAGWLLTTTQGASKDGPDFKLLDLVQAAKKAESGGNLEKKVTSWSAVALYEKTPPDLRKQAKFRAALHKGFAADSKKLKKYLDYDEGVVSKEQKAAYRDEFDVAYSPWADVVGYQRLELMAPGAAGTDPVNFNWVPWASKGKMWAARIELGRFREDTFQFSSIFVAGGLFSEEDWMPSAGIAGWLISAGVAGVGARKNLGQSLRHEVGFLAYPLGVALGDAPNDDDDFFISFLPAQGYYRVYLGDWQFETGVSLPLFEWCDSGLGPFACNNAIMVHIGGG